MTTKAELIRKIETHSDNYDITLIKKAIDYSIEHNNVIGLAKSNYYTTAQIIIELGLDQDCLIACLLGHNENDVNPISQEIENIFGQNVMDLVSDIYRLTSIEEQFIKKLEAEDFQRLILVLSKDTRVLVGKLVNHLRKMGIIRGNSSESARKKLALEAIKIYAPLAECIGSHTLKTELQDLAFDILDTKTRLVIKKNLLTFTTNNINYIQQTIKNLEKLMGGSNIVAKLQGRLKEPYSIWIKMLSKNTNFDQLPDIIGFRIIVDNIKSCYKALGIVHDVYQMIPQYFEDFIKMPKDNGYQSIHTVVIGLDKWPVEIQIRTKAMHHFAEFGFAAHWRYKQRRYNKGDCLVSILI